MASDPARRRFLHGLGLAVTATVAGCVTDPGTVPGGDDGTATTSAAETDDAASATTDATATESDGSATTADGTATATDDLDLREANVVGVELSEDQASGDSTDYRFSVTLYHDDDGEDGYANWWQVERRGGERLGRRKLLHAHSTREFTRSETITIPNEVQKVVVRGHDQTHGYGGRVAVVDVESGGATFLRQGSEPLPLTETDGTPTEEY
jgi:hypothetical protein